MGKKLTEQQTKFIDGVLTGKSRNASAIAAGYQSACVPEKSAQVRSEIALARERLTDLTQIKRVDVIDGIMDGIGMARMQGDSANVIKGWTEVAKILGHYAPEVKVVRFTEDQQRLRSKLEGLSAEDLMNVIDAETREVPSALALDTAAEGGYAQKH